MNFFHEDNPAGPLLLYIRGLYIGKLGEKISADVIWGKNMKK
jgi:hypothetical protein